MTEAGPVDLIDDDNSDTEEGIDKPTRGKLDYDLPGSMPNRGRPVIRTKCLRIAPTGRSFSAATTEGVLVYSIDESFIFDPSDLDIDVAPEAVDAALNEDQPSQALILSLRLNEDSLIKKCIFAVGPVDIPAVASSIPHRYIQRLIKALAELLESCLHLEFILCWCQELYKSHGNSVQQNSRNLLPSLKSLQKAITRIHQDLADTCSSNEYMLRYYVLWATRSDRLRVDWLVLVSAFSQDQECSDFVVMHAQATKVVPQCMHGIHPVLQSAGCKELIDTHKQSEATIQLDQILLFIASNMQHQLWSSV